MPEVTELPTTRQRERANLDDIMARLAELHAAGEIGEVVAVIYNNDKNALPTTFVSTSTTISHFAYAIALLQHHLSRHLDE